jgi:hypothetical protein
MKIIRNTIPDGRLVSEIIGSSSDSPSRPSAPATSVDDFYEEASSRSTTSVEEKEEAPAKSSKTSPKKSAPSLDDLYNDL